LATLDWDIQANTCEAFAEHQVMRMRGQYGQVDARLIHLTRFFLDLSLFFREFIDYKPSEVAAAAIALSEHIIGSRPFMYQNYTEREVECVDSLINDARSASMVLRQKYAHRRLLQVITLVDEFLSQTWHEPEPHHVQYPPPQLSEVKAPELHIQLPDTPPHTPTTMSTVPHQRKSPANGQGYMVNIAGLPTPPSDDGLQMHHVYGAMYSRGTYGRSDSFIAESPVLGEEDMETEYESSDEDMNFTDEGDYEVDSEGDEEIMITEHQVHSYHASHCYDVPSHHKIAPRIVLAAAV
jgi:Cyclin, C-terminal domain